MCCLIVPFAGTWQFLALRLQWEKKDVTSKISKGILEEQVLWKFTDDEAAKELSWEHSSEFKYKGEMYDIICQERIGDTTWYWCHWDRKETKIRKDMQDVLSYALGHSPQQKKNNERIGDFFKTLFLHHSPRLRTQEIKGIYAMHPERNALHVLTYAPSPPFPPPEDSL